jgi:uncharacterized protein
MATITKRAHQPQRFDDLQNIFTGMGTPGIDPNTDVRILQEPLRPQQDYSRLYRSSWFMQRVADSVADAACYAWFDYAFKGVTDAESIEAFYNYMENTLKLNKKINFLDKLSNIHGGALGIILVDDGIEDYSIPVDESSIRAVRGLTVVDRYYAVPNVDFNGFYGYDDPQYFDFLGAPLFDGKQNRLQQKIHASRVIPFYGRKLDSYESSRLSYWGDSLFTPIINVWTRFVTGYSSTTTALKDFDVFVHAIDGLFEMLTSGTDEEVKINEGRIANRLRNFNRSKSTYRGMVIDKLRESADYKSRNFSGVANILEKLRDELIAASGLPPSILFSMFPAGLGATGQSESALWNSVVQKHTNLKYKEGILKLARYVALSKEGPFEGDAPTSIDIVQRDLFPQTQSQTAETRLIIAKTDEIYLRNGVLSPQEVRARFQGTEFNNDVVVAEGIAGELTSEDDEYEIEFSEGDDLSLESKPVIDRYDGVNLTPTNSMRSAARRGLALYSQGKGGSGLQPATVNWARKVASGASLTPQKVVQMRAWLARHESDRKAGWDTPGKETPGFVAMLLWFDNGSGKGRTWAERKVKELESAGSITKRQDKTKEGVSDE